MSVRKTFRRGIVAAAAAAAMVGPAAALAQTADPELSCVPDAVAPGAAVTCSVVGASPSRAVTLELRDGTTVLTSESGVAGTDGGATVRLVVPATAPSRPLTVALVGSDVTFGVTVGVVRPTGVSAGLGPSTSDVARTLPAATVLAAAGLLAAAALPGLRRRGTSAGA